MSYSTAEPHPPGSPGGPGLRVSKGLPLASCSLAVDLAIVTTYATAPVTAISELWVGGDGEHEDGAGIASSGGQGDRGAGLELGMGGGRAAIRLAVAGRSGSSRMSVWDVTEARQILEVTSLFLRESGCEGVVCLLNLCCCCDKVHTQR